MRNSTSLTLLGALIGTTLLSGLALGAQPLKLVSPADRVVISEEQLNAKKHTLIFTWTQQEFGLAYTFELALDPSFGKPVLKQQVQRNLFAYRGLKVGTYYWRVRSKGGARSRVSSFTVQAKAK